MDEGVVTVALLRCACGDFNHARVPGEWSFEELTGEASAPSDCEFLKSVGIDSETR